jgi:hypothetical protein
MLGMGGPDMAPHPRQCSSRPGGAGTLLVIARCWQVALDRARIDPDHRISDVG